MPTITLDISKALEDCTEIGMFPSTLAKSIHAFLSPTAAAEINITLANEMSMLFLLHHNSNQAVITSTNCLNSGCDTGVSIDSLPEIVAKLNEQGVHFTALQFPQTLMVDGRVSGKTRRAHFNHITIYRDSAAGLNASIVDSTMNPIGVYNPIPLIGALLQRSILSGEELLQAKLTRLLGEPETVRSLQNMMDLRISTPLRVTTPILTGKQPSLGDKRCGIYVLNAMAAIINYMLSDEGVTTQAMPAKMAEAHQVINDTLRAEKPLSLS